MKNKVIILFAGLFVCNFLFAQKPNILFFITDDQSFEHTSIAGCDFVNTPAFDEIASEGVRFGNAYVTSPGCSPSRASILTGRYTWEIAEAGTHASSFPTDYKVYPDVLEDNGYFVGYTGKGWGPGDYEASGRKRNPAGPNFAGNYVEPEFSGISPQDYAENFKGFLDSLPNQQPFCFWLGTHEPHRPFEQDSYIKKAKKLENATVPGFLPSDSVIKGDLLDYAVEIEHADQVLAEVIRTLKEKGLYDNTIIIVTSDNGMSFPRAKANCFEYGVHVPLAVRYPKRIQAGTLIETPVSLVDIAPTLLELAGISEKELSDNLSGESLFKTLEDPDNTKNPRPVFFARERHSSSRPDNLGYPQRAVRLGNYLYIRNFHPERWPAGDPLVYDENDSLVMGYCDIDPCPSKTFLVEHQEDPSIKKYLNLAVEKRPAEELYNLTVDPYCLNNLAGEKSASKKQKELAGILSDYLKKTGDARLVGSDPEIFETYPRLKGVIRKFPDQHE